MQRKLLAIIVTTTAGGLGILAVVSPNTFRDRMLPLGGASSEPTVSDARFVGAQRCALCHRDRFESFRQTAHHLTSQLPSRSGVPGPFEGAAATMKTGEASLWFEMSADEQGLYQTAARRRPNGLVRRTERFDIVLGSGKLGQSYLFWSGNELFQLPVSYATSHGGWVNSPGFPDGTAHFDRPIGPRCLECHVTYVDGFSGRNNVYNRPSLILGISCERCHGEGGRHVEHHEAHPDDTKGRFIVHPGRLERERILELCSQCHSGIGESLRPPFSYRPGEPIDEYIALVHLDMQRGVGIHSNNQLPRLRQSKCFRQSETMTCVSCHDPHVYERANLAMFSKRCMECHDSARCAPARKLGNKARENCIDCHMPTQSVIETIIDDAKGGSFPKMRDHRIGVYLEETERFTSHAKSSTGN